jgi:hypothetical protein
MTVSRPRARWRSAKSRSPERNVVGARGSSFEPDGIRYDVGNGLGFGFALALGRTGSPVASVHQFVRDFVCERSTVSAAD